MNYFIKIIISAIIITLASEVAKVNEKIASFIIALPLLSIITIFFLYYETKNIEKIALFSIDVFWLVIPTLIFFLSLTWLLRRDFGFYPSMGVSLACMFVLHFLTVRVLNKF